MSIDENARRVLLALASYEKIPHDPERGHHALEGAALVRAAALSGGILEDAVNMLDDRKLLKRHRFAGDSIGNIRLNTQGRLEAEKLLRGSSESEAAAASPEALPTTEPSEHKLPRLEVTYGEQLGEGAFGTVWRATDSLLERDVAVKFLTSTAEAMDEDALIREARTLARVAHPNLVTVYMAAYLRHPVTCLVAPALTMELLVGETLGKWWERKREHHEILRVATGIITGVLAMHGASLVHGDLHEGNIMVLTDATPKLIDWRYQDTPLLRSSSHRRNEIAAEQRRAIDRISLLLEKQGLLDDSVVIRRETNLETVAAMLEKVLAPSDLGPTSMPTRIEPARPETPLQRFRRLLDDPAAWRKMEGDSYLYCEQFPEFTVVDGETYTDGFSEPWTKHFPDPSARSFEVQLRYHQTVLEKVSFVACDGERYRVPMPKPVRGEDGTLRYVISTSSIGWKLAQIYKQYYPLATAYPLTDIELTQ